MFEPAQLFFKLIRNLRSQHTFGMLTGLQMFKILTYKAFSSSHQLAINILREIGVFVEANPSKIVTIIIEDYVRSPNSINKVFDVAGLRNLWFPVSQIPKSGREWATIADMLQHNQRLVVFTSKFAKESSEGIAYIPRSCCASCSGAAG
ncbi:hypothetical protein P3S68_026290 [Capsicum galapagoense]